MASTTLFRSCLVAAGQLIAALGSYWIKLGYEPVPDRAALTTVDGAIRTVTLASLYSAQARYAEAKLLFKRSLTTLEKTFVPEHPSVARALDSFAGNYRGQGRYAEAEPLYKRSLAIREKAFPADHPLVATSLINLAALYEAQGRAAEAEPLRKRAQAIWENRPLPPTRMFDADDPMDATARGSRFRYAIHTVQ